jgi:hypothetical protein
MLGVRAGGTNTLHAMLMAVLVVAAALVAGVVVFDLEDDVLPSESTPSASIGFEYDEDTGALTIEHRGGDALDADRVVFLNEGFQSLGTFEDTEQVTAGDRAVLPDVDDEATVYVMWIVEDGQYVTLATWNPHAENASPTSTAPAGNSTATPATPTTSANFEPVPTANTATARTASF